MGPYLVCVGWMFSQVRVCAFWKWNMGPYLAFSDLTDERLFCVLWLDYTRRLFALQQLFFDLLKNAYTLRILIPETPYFKGFVTVLKSCHLPGYSADILLLNLSAPGKTANYGVKSFPTKPIYSPDKIYAQGFVSMKCLTSSRIFCIKMKADFASKTLGL